MHFYAASSKQIHNYNIDAWNPLLIQSKILYDRRQENQTDSVAIHAQIPGKRSPYLLACCRLPTSRNNVHRMTLAIHLTADHSV